VSDDINVNHGFLIKTEAADI